MFGIGFNGIGLPVPRGNPSEIQYLLRDEFITDRAAGSVNGTAAEPIGGNRTATDTGGKLSITGGRLTFSGTTTNNVDPRCLYPSHARAAGKILFCDFTLDSGATIHAGWSSNTTASPLYHSVNITATLFNVRFNGTNILVSTIVPSSVAIALRSSGNGAHHFAKIAGQWQLLWIQNASAVDALYPGVGASNGGASNAFYADLLRIPADLFLPTPICSDGFGSAFGSSDGLGHAEGIAGGIGSGGGGLTWTGSTWSVSAGKAINTPGVGSELLTDGALESWSSSTNLTNYTEELAGTTTVNQEASIVHGGSNSARIDVDSSNSTGQFYQQVTAAIGDWLTVSVWIRSSASGKTGSVQSSQAGLSTIARDPGTTWAQYFLAGRVGTTNPRIYLAKSSAASASIYFDDFSVQKLTLADLFSSVSVSTPDVMADVALTIISGTQAGLVLNLDSTSSPAHFVIAYHDGTNCKLEKCVAGTYTTVVTAAATYSANAVLRVSKIGTAYRLYYNNQLVGSGTISDAGIISNSRHGIFSTYSQNTCDNLVIYASGTEGQYSLLNQY